MGRAVCILAAAFFLAIGARADTLPPGKKLIPRHIEIRDLDKTGDDLLVMHVCYPARGGDFGQDYCVLQSSGPFRLQGQPYFIPKKRVRLEMVKDNQGTKDSPRALRIRELAPYGVETRAFFEKSPLVRRVGELRAADNLVISATSDIMTVTDVWRVAQGSEGVATVQAEKVVFRCRTGEKIERVPAKDPLLEPIELPSCPRDTKPVAKVASTPAPAASATPASPSGEVQPRSGTELGIALGAGFLLIGAVAALASRKRS